MKKFSDFAKESILDGEKVKIDDIINKEIKIIGYAIKDSKYKSKLYLTLQIIRENNKYVIFTGSSVLIDQLEKYKNKIPFVATIRKNNKYYSLT